GSSRVKLSASALCWETGRSGSSTSVRLPSPASIIDILLLVADSAGCGLKKDSLRSDRALTRWDLFPCRGPVVPCRTLSTPSATVSALSSRGLINQQASAVLGPKPSVNLTGSNGLKEPMKMPGFRRWEIASNTLNNAHSNILQRSLLFLIS